MCSRVSICVALGVFSPSVFEGAERFQLEPHFVDFVQPWPGSGSVATQSTYHAFCGQHGAFVNAHVDIDVCGHLPTAQA